MDYFGAFPRLAVGSPSLFGTQKLFISKGRTPAGKFFSALDG
jgi:hypothetical protein